MTDAVSAEVIRGNPTFKEMMTDSIKKSLTTVLPWKSDARTEEEQDQTKLLVEKVEKLTYSSDDANDNKENIRMKKLQETEDAESMCSEDSNDEQKSTVITRITYLLYFLLWVTLYAIAIEFQFGAVYFILSTFVLIWVNTRSRPKKKGEPSAYSVFNPNCEAIHGTLDASQLEREFGYKMY